MLLVVILLAVLIYFVAFRGRTAAPRASAAPPALWEPEPPPEYLRKEYDVIRLYKRLPPLTDVDWMRLTAWVSLCREAVSKNTPLAFGDPRLPKEGRTGWDILRDGESVAVTPGGASLVLEMVGSRQGALPWEIVR
jgi:hypothetical protein